MIDILTQLAAGFVNCLTPLNMAMLVVGIVIGLLIGVLPGLTLVMGVALALPFTYKMDVTASIVLLTAMYVSGTYGGAFTAILFRIPGEPIDVPMLWDGYTMGRKGKPAKALGWTLVAALGGGLLSAVVMVALTQPLAKFALRFSSPEYFVIVLFGLLSVVAIGKGSLANAFISMSVGILISSVGTDPIYGAYRFTFGSPILADGIEFLVVMVGAYGVGEVLTRLETGFATKPLDKISNARTELPTLKELNDIKGMFFRASVVGDLIGLLPGAGATIASFVSYGIEARFGKRRDQMGTGVAEGIVAPQAAATASVGGAMVHLLALGIPGSGATAVILGRFHVARHSTRAPGPREFGTARLYRIRLVVSWPRTHVRHRVFCHPAAGEDPRFSRGGGVGLRADPLFHRCFVDPQQRYRPLADHRLRRARLWIRAAEVSGRAAGARCDPWSDRRRSIHEYNDQFL